MVRLLAACLTPPRLCLVMELMETSLDRLIHDGEGPGLALDTVGAEYDHSRGVASIHAKWPR